MNGYKISDKYTFISKNFDSVANLKRKVLESGKGEFLFPEWTHYCREIEVSLISSALPENNNVLEIGSGDGYVAHILEKKSEIKIIASDMKPRFPQYYNVEVIDGQSTGINGRKYDAIISVHVLEHIEDLDKALNEFSRLLEDGGIMYHLVPSKATMYFTILMQPLAYIRNFWLYINGYHLSKSQPFKNRNILRFFMRFIKSINPINFFWGAGHGVYDRVDCLKYWGIREWENKFIKNNFEIINVYTTETSYSMHKIFPFKFVILRKYLAKLGFSSANLFILKKKDDV